MDYDKRYFMVSRHFSFPYEFTLREQSDGTFIDVKTGCRYRKRLLYDSGWGQEDGYEMLPPLSFYELISLVESPLPFVKEKLPKKQRAKETENYFIHFYNLLGAVSCIMQDYVDEFIDFLSEKINTFYFEDLNIRENYRWFDFSSKKTKELGRIPGGVLTKSYEDVFNLNPKWQAISQKVILKVYQ